jgi:predicted Zn finger-like uncharacterized protein
MLIVCPSCASSYSLTAEQLGAGRNLRCASCRHKWYVTPDAALPDDAPIPEMPALAAEPVATAEATPEPMPALDPPVQKAARPTGRPRKAQSPGFGALARGALQPSFAKVAALALLVILGGGLHQRRTVVSILPQTAPLFAAIGMPVNLRGLEFRQVRAELGTDKDQPVLIVEGEIRGVAPGRSRLTPLTVTVRDSEGHKILEWVSDAPVLALGPGETAPFRARLVWPPSEGNNVMVRFSERDSRIARQ